MKTDIKRSWHNFSLRFTRHGIAAQAVREAGFEPSDSKKQGWVLLQKPDILIDCFAVIARRRKRSGTVPKATVARKLGDAAVAALRPGITRGRAAAKLPKLRKAFRQFCLAQGWDSNGLLPDEDPTPDAAGDPAETTETPAPITLPPPDLPPVFVPLLKRSRYKGAYGGRGSGKSHVFAELMVRRCIEAAPVRAVCIREVQRSLDQSVKRLIEDKIQALGVGAAFRVQADRIYRGVIGLAEG